MTVSQMLGALSAYELEEWKVYFQLKQKFEKENYEKQELQRRAVDGVKKLKRK